MALTVSTIPANAQGAPSGAPKGVAAGNGEGPDVFGSLLATLLALTAGNAGTPQQKGDGQPQTNPADLSAQLLSQLASLSLQQTGETEEAAPVGEAPENPLDKILGDLLASIQQALESLNKGEQPSDKVLASIAQNLNDFAKVLPQANLNIAVASAAADGGPATPLAKPITTQDIRDILAAAAKPAEASAQTVATDKQPRQQAAETLASLIAKLGQDNPDVAQKLEAIVQKLINPNAKAEVAVNAAQPQSDAAEFGQAVAALKSGKAEGSVTTPDRPGARNGLHVTETTLNATQPAAKTETANPVQPVTAQARPEIEPKAAKPEGIAGLDGTKPAAEKAAGGDLLLQAQAAGTNRVEVHQAPRMMTAAYNQPAQNVNVPHIAFEMASQFKAGMSRFEIRLDPPEMGKIDVSMKVDNQGQVHARLVVERAETLDLLQRDARHLERALAQSGLDSAKTSLEFSLKQNPFNGRDSSGDQQQNGRNFSLADADSNDELAPVSPAAIAYRAYVSPGGVNMWA